jgi:hypothetical protein
MVTYREILIRSILPECRACKARLHCHFADKIGSQVCKNLRTGHGCRKLY